MSKKVHETLRAITTVRHICARTRQQLSTAAASVHRLHEGLAASVSIMSLQRLSREAVARSLQQNATRPLVARLFHASAAVQADDQIECKVNGEPVHVPKGSTVMQACDAAGIDIPRQGVTF